MKHLLLFISGTFWFGLGIAQPVIQWQRTIGGTEGDHAYSLQLADNGDLMVAGFSLSSDGDFVGGYGATEVWLVRMDSLGNLLWKGNYGGTEDDRAYAISPTKDQGWVFTGFTRSNNIQVSGNHGLQDFWVVKLDQAGNINWQKCLGGSGYEIASDIKETPDGGYIVVGYSDSSDGDLTENNGLEDLWVVKLDTDGSVVWQHSYGGSGQEEGRSVVCTNDGGYLVAGESFSNDGDVIQHLGGIDYWVLKLNSDGKIEWQRVLGGSGLESAMDVLQTREGGYMVFGQSRSTNGNITNNHGGYDLWAVKLDAEGEIEWERSYGGANEDYGQAIVQTINDGFLMVGQTTSTDGDAIGNDGLADAWVIKTDSIGNIEWQKTLGGTQDEIFRTVQQGADGSIYLAGHARSNNGDVTGVKGKIDYWVVKLGSALSGTEAPEALPLLLHPNPATSWFVLGLPAVEPDMFIQITDAQGRVQRSWKTSSDIRLDVFGLSAGIYQVMAVSASGQRYSGQLVKE
jgi:hypothetical protein